MIALTYTQTIEQESILRQIEMLRGELLSGILPLPHERARRWATNIDTIRTAYTLAQIPVHSDDIEDAIRTRKPRAQAVLYKRFWNALQEITESWTGTDKSHDLPAYLSVFRSVLVDKTSDSRAWADMGTSLSMGLSYIGSGNVHPVVQSSVISAILFTSYLEKKEAIVCATLAFYGVCATYGYTCQGRISPVANWMNEPESLQKAMESIDKTKNLNHWILFVSLSLKKVLEDAVKSVEKHDAYTYIDQYTTLTDRQKSILHLLDKPKSTINNAFVKRYFGVSQMTASRDLTYLTSIGLLSQYGKSRSTFYTKIG